MSHSHNNISLLLLACFLGCYQSLWSLFTEKQFRLHCNNLGMPRYNLWVIIVAQWTQNQATTWSDQITHEKEKKKHFHATWQKKKRELAMKERCIHSSRSDYYELLETDVLITNEWQVSVKLETHTTETFKCNLTTTLWISFNTDINTVLSFLKTQKVFLFIFFRTSLSKLNFRRNIKTKEHNNAQ